MTKITSVYRMDDGSAAAAAVDDPSSSSSASSSTSQPAFEFERRQLPMAVSADRKITMVIDLRPRGLSYDHNILRARELDDFAAKYHILTADERRASLSCTRAQFVAILSQSVPCVGCRRSVERLYDQLQRSGHPTLEPVQITSDGVLTVLPAELAKPPVVAALLHKHQSLLTALLENQPRNKKSSRCTLHSLDSFRSRPFSDMWREVWGCMKQECREEMTQISTVDLHRTLDAYLKKHKFCQECRTKVEKAYGLLLTERNPNKEKGYVAGLYANIKKCIPNKHIHLRPKTEFIDGLIRRAEPELNGNHTRHRERHAKTLEIAQEEVLTCIGMFIYERLRRVHLCLKEEENAVQVLAAVAAHALCRSFDTAVEQKRGISNLELLYQEISRAERAKKARQELKKLKKKQKKGDKQQQQLQHLQQLQQQQAAANGDDEDDDEEDYEEDDDDDDDDDEEEEDSMAEVCEMCDGSKAHKTSGTQPQPLLDVCTCEDAHADELSYDTEEQDTSSMCCSEFNDAAEEKSSVHSAGQGGGSVGCGSCTANDSKTNRTNVAAPNHTIFAMAECDETCGCNANIASTGTADGAVGKITGGGAGTADAGYGSETTLSLLSSRTSSFNSSPDGSEVACSEGFCNHDVIGDVPLHRHRGGLTSLLQQQPHHQTLQEMLDDSAESDDDHECSTIPAEVLLDYQYRQVNIKDEREQLRRELRHRFAVMCVKTQTTNGAT